MNPISSARPTANGLKDTTRFVWGHRERHPRGFRFGIGNLQVVIGYLNRFAIWWNYRAIVDLYPTRNAG